MKTHRNLTLGLFACLFLLGSCTDSEIVDQKTGGSIATKAVANTDGILHWNTEEQNIDGFGVAQAGWADYLYAHRKRDTVLDLMFGKEGLHLNILRGEIYSHYWKNEGDTSFHLDEDIDMPLDDPFFDIDYSADGNEAAEEIAQRKGQLWINQRVKALYDVDKFVYSVWSPPAYMKSNGSDSEGNLKSAYYQKFADYLSAFCDAYSSVGLKPYAISPANEPEYAAPWSSCLWLPGTTTLGRFIVNNMGPTFAANHPDVKIIFGENAQWTGILGFIMGSKNYVRDILNLNTRITNYPIIAAGHGYVDPVTKKDPGIEPFTKAKTKNIPVWLTEISDPHNSYSTSIEDGLNWAVKFHRYLCEANVSSIIWWAGALPDSGTNEGLIYISKNRTDYETGKRYETFGNFTRYIPVGSTRISAEYNSDQGYMVSGYKKGNNFTIVAINTNDTETTIDLALDNSQTASPLAGYLTDATHKWEALETIQPIGNTYMITLPAKSVVTFTGNVE